MIRCVGTWCGKARWNAQRSTIWLKILKIGTVLVCNTRRIRLFFARAHPLQELFRTELARLSST